MHCPGAVSMVDQPFSATVDLQHLTAEVTQPWQCRSSHSKPTMIMQLVGLLAVSRQGQSLQTSSFQHSSCMARMHVIKLRKTWPAKKILNRQDMPIQFSRTCQPHCGTVGLPQADHANSDHLGDLSAFQPDLQLPSWLPNVHWTTQGQWLPCQFDVLLPLRVQVP